MVSKKVDLSHIRPTELDEGQRKVEYQRLIDEFVQTAKTQEEALTEVIHRQGERVQRAAEVYLAGTSHATSVRKVLYGTTDASGLYGKIEEEVRFSGGMPKDGYNRPQWAHNYFGLCSLIADAKLLKWYQVLPMLRCVEFDRVTADKKTGTTMLKWYFRKIAKRDKIGNDAIGTVSVTDETTWEKTIENLVSVLTSPKKLRDALDAGIPDDYELVTSKEPPTKKGDKEPSYTIPMYITYMMARAERDVLSEDAKEKRSEEQEYNDNVRAARQLWAALTDEVEHPDPKEAAKGRMVRVPRRASDMKTLLLHKLPKSELTGENLEKLAAAISQLSQALLDEMEARKAKLSTSSKAS